MLAPFECLCGNFILPESASYVFFYAVSNLRNLLYLIAVVRDGRLELPTSCSQSKRATNCANPGFLVIQFCTRCGQTCGQAVFLTISACGGSACIADVSRDCEHGIFRLEGGATRSQSKRATNCANSGYEIQTDPTAGCSNSGVCLQMATPQNLTAVHVACRKRTECRRKTILYFTEICRKVKSYIEEAPCP